MKLIMKGVLTFGAISVFLLGCSTYVPLKTSDDLLMEQIAAAPPVIDGHGYSVTGPNDWIVTAGTRITNASLGKYLEINYAHTVPSANCKLGCTTQTFMWFTTPVDERVCDTLDFRRSYSDDGNAGLKISGRWHKGTVSCTTYGRLLFSPISYLSFKDMYLEVVVYFDRSGEAERVFQTDASFDNSGLISAMRYVQLKSLEP